MVLLLDVFTKPLVRIDSSIVFVMMLNVPLSFYVVQELCLLLLAARPQRQGEIPRRNRGHHRGPSAKTPSKRIQFESQSSPSAGRYITVKNPYMPRGHKQIRTRSLKMACIFRTLSAEARILIKFSKYCFSQISLDPICYSPSTKKFSCGNRSGKVNDGFAVPSLLCCKPIFRNSSPSRFRTKYYTQYSA